MRHTSIGCLLTIGVLAAAPLRASPITELELAGTISNNTLATAEVLPGLTFTTPVPSTAFDPPGYPTATVTGTGGGYDIDVFAFFVSAGGNAYFDVDNTDPLMDNMLSLFDSTGTLIGFGEDQGAADAGSSTTLDPFIGVIPLPSAGTYYLAISQWPNFPIASFFASPSSLTRPDGEFGGFAMSNAPPGDSSFAGSDVSIPDQPYVIHLSVQNAADAPAPVPEPTTVALLSVGLAGLGVRRWRQRKA